MTLEVGDRVAKPSRDKTSELRGEIIDIVDLRRPCPYLVRWSGGKERWENVWDLVKRPNPKEGGDD